MYGYNYPCTVYKGLCCIYLLFSNEFLDYNELLLKVRNSPKMQGLNLVKAVTTKREFLWSWDQEKKNSKIIKMLVIDFGVKTNILRQLSQYSCSLLVVPENINIKRIIQLNPDAIILTNGPGDPASAKTAVATVGEIINSYPQIPIFGICLGHQILSLVFGSTTFKLKFGHRGLNHPSGLSKQVEITSQNHGFAVQLNDTSNTKIQINYINLNDNTLAGVSYKDKPIFSVQHHPEASPGPHDSMYLFSDFIDLIKYSL
uniref:carbamoyl-phosphate synthase (glutamine-hydrolyzing) n=1 Tax=Compsopogon caeruleus TaxID=31354 RepID=A0A1Z1XAV7_9RHOD|nr:carbamoyl phosphate synthase small subunit [Compsopogon caeruleus]ARX95984.1 carbamoyl phosphate synthase small subunit [Compsopogon caeruleus]